MNKNHLYKQDFTLTQRKRIERLNQRPKLIWFTGLSGSGKSTLSNELEKILHKKGFFVYSLDGDNVRLGLCKNLSFSNEDRTENIRRVAEMSKLMLDAGLIVIASFISPLKSHRQLVKEIVGEENFIEIYIATPIEICEKRDVKGLYKQARTGQIKHFTGVSAKYEKPEQPTITIDTSKCNIENSVEKIVNNIKNELSV